jgi:hypothetical protein
MSGRRHLSSWWLGWVRVGAPADHAQPLAVVDPDPSSPLVTPS